MSIDVTTDIVIRKPLTVVAGFAALPDNTVAWSTNVSSVTWITEKPLRTGSRLTYTADFIGRSQLLTYEVIEFEPNVRLFMRALDSPFEIETAYIWTPTSASTTRMTLRIYGEPVGFFGLASPLLALLMKRVMTQNLTRLKQILESG